MRRINPIVESWGSLPVRSVFVMHLLAGTIFDRPPHCDRCDKPETECCCPPLTPVKNVKPPEKQTARLTVEKRKKGKLMTVIRGLAASDNDFPQLLSQLKNACGAGGTIEADEIEIQGDQIARLQRVLSEIGYRVR